MLSAKAHANSRVSQAIPVAQRANGSAGNSCRGSSRRPRGARAGNSTRPHHTADDGMASPGLSPRAGSPLRPLPSPAIAVPRSVTQPVVGHRQHGIVHRRGCPATSEPQRLAQVLDRLLVQAGAEVGQTAVVVQPGSRGFPGKSRLDPSPWERDVVHGVGTDQAGRAASPICWPW